MRPLTWLFLLIAGSISVVAVISSSHAIDPGRLASVQDDTRVTVDIAAAAGATPTPLPCPGCWDRFTFSGNFDAVTPPALPPDWIATNAQGPPPLWVSSNSGVPMPPWDSPPNAVYVDDPAVMSDKRLDSQGVSFFEGCCVRLSFRHNFNLEASDQNPNLGYDGGVLEVSTDGGNTFQDILAAGGHFVLGGYNRTISTDRESPIAGRRAWSGNSGGFVTTVVDVPPFQNYGTRFRWRMASDSSGSGEGWRVDTVYIIWCHGFGPPCTPTPIPTPTPRPTTTPRARPSPAPRRSAESTAQPLRIVDQNGQPLEMAPQRPRKLFRVVIRLRTLPMGSG
jgi:hypothetical protein